VSDPEPNNFLPEATLISGNSKTMGMVQDPGDWEDWYKFTANAGDQIKVTVNWAPTIFPNMVLVDLMDQYGGWLANAPETVSPKTITYTAMYTGTYHVHLQTMAGRIGYNLALKVIDTIPPTVNIDPVATPTKVNSQTISGAMEAGAAVAVSINTAAVAGPVTYPTATTWNCTVSGLVEGPNDITVTAADLAGNSSLATTSITVDTVAPIVTISSPVAGISDVNAPFLSYIAETGVVDVSRRRFCVTEKRAESQYIG
jgi:hypothetical protein